MTTLHERLKFRALLLGALDVQREQSEDPGLGQTIERYLVDSELADLEAATKLVEIRESS